MSSTSSTATSTLVLKAKDETEGAFNSLKERLESVKSILEKAMVWKAGEMLFEGAVDTAKDFVSGLIGSNAAVETLKTSMAAFYGNTKQAGEAVEYLSQFSLKAPFSKDDIEAAGQEIASFHQNLAAVLPAIGNVAAAMGVDIPTATDALEKAVNTGSLRGLTSTLHITKQELIDFGAQTTKTGALVQASILPAFEKLSSAQFGSGMSSQLNTFAGATTNLHNQLDNLAEIAGKPLFNVLEQELKDMVGFLSAHQADVNAFAQNLGQGIGWAARAAADGFKYIAEAVGTFTTWFRGAVLPAIETTIGLFAIAFGPGGLGQVAGIIGNQLGTWAAEFGAWLGPALESFLTTWPKTMNSILDAIGRQGPPLAKAFGTWALNVLPTLVEDLAKINDAVVLFIAESAITFGLKLASWGLAFTTWAAGETISLAADMKNMGVHVVQGLIDGIKSMAGDLGNTVKNSITDVVKDIPGVEWIMQSPSHLFFGYGVNISQGLIDGITSMLPQVAAAMNALSSEVKTSFRPGQGSEVHTSEMGLNAQQRGQNILYGWFGGTGVGGGDTAAMPNLSMPNIAPLVLPVMPKIAALPGVTGGAAGVLGSSGGGSRVPIGYLGANFGHVLATGGVLHSGTSPTERYAQRQAQASETALSKTDQQTAILASTAQTLHAMATDIAAMAQAVIRGGTPQPLPENHARMVGVYRPGR